MRLVDADALKAEFDKNCAMECACCDNATCNHARNAVGCGLVDAAPTIDAITVEWLNKQCEMADDRGDMEMTDAISWLIQTWQEEQEAQYISKRRQEAR